MKQIDGRWFLIRHLQEKAKNSITLNLVELLGTSKLAKNKKHGGEGLIVNMMAYSVSIRPIRAGAFNAFNSLETTTGSDYSFRNSVILDLGFTCNIGNAKWRFDPESFRPPREGEEDTVYASDVLVLIESYRIISVTIQIEGFLKG
jgi:hypothetical protein